MAILLVIVLASCSCQRAKWLLQQLRVFFGFTWIPLHCYAPHSPPTTPRSQPCRPSHPSLRCPTFTPSLDRSPLLPQPPNLDAPPAPLIFIASGLYLALSQLCSESRVLPFITSSKPNPSFHGPRDWRNFHSNAWPEHTFNTNRSAQSHAVLDINILFKHPTQIQSIPHGSAPLS